MTLIIRTIQ